MDKPTKSWIVLMDRVPRGPLTESEVSLLLERHLLHRNDLAFLVTSAQKSEWKFLWQFPEFDRRDGKPPEQKPEVETERRNKEIEDAKKKAIKELPPEWLNIAPEELVLKHSRPILQSTESVPVTIEEPSVESASTHFVTKGRIFAGGAVLAFVVVAFLTMLPGSNNNEEVAKTVESPKPVFHAEPAKAPERFNRAPASRIQPAPPPPREEPRVEPRPEPREERRGRIEEPSDEDRYKKGEEEEREASEAEEPRPARKTSKKKVEENPDEEREPADEEGTTE